MLHKFTDFLILFGSVLIVNTVRRSNSRHNKQNAKELHQRHRMLNMYEKNST